MSRKQRPQFIVKMPPRDPRGKYWREIGAAWVNKEGTGLSIQLEVLPLPDDRNMVRLVALPRTGVEVAIAAKDAPAPEEDTSFDPADFDGDDGGEA